MIAIVFVNGKKLKTLDISNWAFLGPLGVCLYDRQGIKNAAINAVGTTTGNIQVFVPEYGLL